ncbi:MAG: serine/threonine protein kinase [Proteobacteria bacterium]|nr:serine/threonine protein kinase [Pseudomonadota bacterium]
MSEVSNIHSYSQLDPDTIIDAIESLDYISDKRILALNSYENRVYQIGIEDEAPIIAKFYRSGRWTDEMIKEEHEFTLELVNAEIPVVAPLIVNNETLFKFKNYRFSIYPRFGGYAPELDNPDHLLQLGRILAQLHNIGETKPFAVRPEITIEDFAIKPAKYLQENKFIPAYLEIAYSTLTDDLIKQIKNCFEQAGNYKSLRLHGDCHHGNVLTRDEKFYIVDLDDTRTGPAIQDFWMFLSGDRSYMTARLNDFMEGYTEFRDLDPRELHLIEALRTMRLIYYSAWLAQRWDDPAFPIAFPFFNTQQYWEEQILGLREQAALMEEPPLVWQK